MSSYRPSVFVSATSRDLGACRAAVDHVLLSMGIVPIAQDYFPPDYRTLVDFLRDRIVESDAVITLVGTLFGEAPNNRPDRSYTQIEYDVARELGKPVYVFLTSDAFCGDHEIGEDAEKTERQARHREALMQGHKCTWFASSNELRVAVAEMGKDLHGLVRLPMFYLHPPSPPAYFAGRVLELSQLEDAMRRKHPSIVLVLGIGGQGKTTLVYEWLRNQQTHRFTAGFWCTAYGNEYNFDMFLDAALEYFLGGKFEKRRLPDVAARSSKLLALMQVRPILLVLDGVERWLSGWNTGPTDSEAVDTVDARRGFFDGLDEFLRGASGLHNGTHVVITTRAIPSVLDDAERSVVPVYEDPDEDLALRGLDEGASVALLRRLGVKGSDEDLERAAAAYAHHPLALSVLGGLLAKKMGGRIDALPHVDSLDPHRALFALFEETRRNMPGGRAAEKLVCTVAHAFEHPTLDAIVDVTGRCTREEALECFVTLADWQLLTWDGERRTVRMHPLVKRYFANRVGAKETRSIHSRFARWYEQRPVAETPATLEDVRSRVLAIEHALAADDMPLCRDLVLAQIGDRYAFVEWLAAWGHYPTGIDLLGRLAEAAEPAAEVELRIARSALERQFGTLPDALGDLNRSLELLQAKSTKRAPTRDLLFSGALLNRGNVYHQLSRLDEALSDYGDALRIVERLPESDPNRRAQTATLWMSRGIVLREMGRYSEGVDAGAQSVTLHERAMDVLPDPEPALMAAYINRANVLAERQDTTEALADYDRAITIASALVKDGRLEMETSHAHARTARAATLVDAGDTRRALKELDDTIESIRRLIDGGRRELRWLLALSWIVKSQGLLKEKRWQDAMEDSTRALEMYRHLVGQGRDDLDGWLAHALLNRAEAAFQLGRTDDATQDRAEGFDILRRHILAGEPETRVLYLRKSVSAAAYLWYAHAEEAMRVLDDGLSQAERGAERNEATEALAIEARRGLELLGPLRPEFRARDSRDWKRLAALARRLE